jgi:hypothetical protein
MVLILGSTFNLYLIVTRIVNLWVEIDVIEKPAAGVVGQRRKSIEEHLRIGVDRLDGIW